MLARKRNDAILTAYVAVNPHKTANQNSAIQECSQFTFHKPGHYPPSLLLLGQKSLDILSHHLLPGRAMR
jgi:hypothetical protein